MTNRSARQDVSVDPASEGGPALSNQDLAITAQIVRAVQDAVHHGLLEVKSDLARTEARSHTDYFRTLCAFATGFVVLAGMVIESYRWGHDELTSTTAKIEARIDTVEGRIDKRLDKIEDRIDKIDDRMITIGNNLARTDQKLQDLSDRLATPPMPAVRR